MRYGERDFMVFILVVREGDVQKCVDPEELLKILYFFNIYPFQKYRIKDSLNCYSLSV